MTVRRLGFMVFLTVWGFGCWANLAKAQGTSGLESAKRAYLEGRFEDSIRELQPLLETLTEADDLRDAHFFLGLNYLALGRGEDAKSQFSAAVKQDPDFAPPASLYSPDIVAAYQDARQGLVGRLQVLSEPPGAQVSLAGKPLGQTPLENTVLAGEYMIRAELDGHTPVERAVQVRAGEETEITLSLRAVIEPERVETPEESEPTTTEQVSTGGGGVSGKTIGIIAGVGGGAAVALVAAGGGSDGGTSPSPSTPSTPTPTASRANVTASIAPNPMIAQPSGNSDFPWRVDFEVIVRETAGLGGNIDFINTILLNTATGGETPALNFGAGDVIGQAGTNHVDARGSLTVPLAIRYRLAGGRRQAILIAEIRFTDDRGNVHNLRAEAVIQ